VCLAVPFYCLPAPSRHPASAPAATTTTIAPPQGDWGTQFGMLIQYMAEKREGGLNAATDEDVADLQVGAAAGGWLAGWLGGWVGGCWWVGAGGWFCQVGAAVSLCFLSRQRAGGRCQSQAADMAGAAATVNRRVVLS
jgi:hypothetical protein